MRTWGRALVWGLTLSFAGSCVAMAEEELPRFRRGQFQRANVIFVEFTDTRRDRLGCYGAARSMMPVLDAVARHSVRFEHVVAAAPWCVPGKNSIWTGLYPSAHGVVNKYSVDAAGAIQRAQLSSAIPTFPELLKRQAGYTLVAFTGGAGVSGISGLGRGFDLYQEGPDFSGFSVTVPPAVEWLRHARKEPFFMFLQSYSAHGQAGPPAGGYRKTFTPDYHGTLTGSAKEFEEVREQSLKKRFSLGGLKSLGFSPEDQAFYLGLYNERVQDSDQWIGQFLASLDALELSERTIIVFFSGHGDEYFDHGFSDHGTSLYEEVIHVPVIIALPGMTDGRVVHPQIRTVDLFPTVFELLGLSHPPVAGVSVVPAMNGQSMMLPGVSETEYRLFRTRALLSRQTTTINSS